jgi:hypothetical protein
MDISLYTEWQCKVMTLPTGISRRQRDNAINEHSTPSLKPHAFKKKKGIRDIKHTHTPILLDKPKSGTLRTQGVGENHESTSSYYYNLIKATGSSPC